VQTEIGALSMRRKVILLGNQRLIERLAHPLDDQHQGATAAVESAIRE
jgi:hypothetical protein